MIYLVRPGMKQQEQLSKPLRQARFLTRLLGIFVLSCVILGVSFLVSIHRFEQRGKDLLLQQMRSQQIASHLMIDFRWLVQEWENTLLRGSNPDEFKRYWSALQTKHSEIQVAGRELQTLSQGKQLDRITLTLENMNELLVHYESAIVQARSNQGWDPFKADALVKGRDRQVLQPLHDYLIEMQREQKEGMEEHFSFIAKLQLSLMLCFFLTLLLSYWLGRSGFSKWAVREDQLEAQNSKLRSLGRLSANIIHEIKNPITVIDGRCQMIHKLLQHKDSIPVEKIEECLNSMQKVNDRVVRIIKTLSKLSRHAHDLDYVRVQPRILLNEVDIIIKSRFLENQTELKWIIPDKVPDIIGREIEISQVLINLLLNSLDAIQNLEQKWVTLEVQADDAFLLFTITDSGSGIPLDTIRKIGREAYTSKSQGQGTGQGMQITKRIIREHQGFFAYDETVSHTCFRIGLPLANTTSTSPAVAA